MGWMALLKEIARIICYEDGYVEILEKPINIFKNQHSRMKPVHKCCDSVSYEKLNPHKHLWVSYIF